MNPGPDETMGQWNRPGEPGTDRTAADRAFADRATPEGAPILPRVPTSEVLEDLLGRAPADQVTFAWIVANLRERSFGVVFLVLALIGLLPGASLPIAVLLPVPAVQLIRARPEPRLPRFIANRQVATPRLARMVARLTPLLKRLERVVRPRWLAEFDATERIVGVTILFMAASMFSPFPFSHVLPLLVTMLIAVAYLEDDGLLLCIALFAAVVSLAITAAVLWGTVEAWMLIENE